MDYTIVKGRHNVETEYRIAAICYNLTRAVSIIGMNGLKKKLKRLQNGFIRSIPCLVNTIKVDMKRIRNIVNLKFKMENRLSCRNMAHIAIN